jgi:predicted DNA-binding protein (MmcQ/YjbR family)
MDNIALRAYCLSKPGASETFPFGDDVRVIKVMGKMFALIPTAGPVTISLKCEPTWAQILRSTYPAVRPGYHLNKEHWNSIVMDETIPDDEVKSMINHSYELVVKGLTKAQRKRLEQA